MIGRRGFLSLLGLGAAGIAAGEELWVPGRKLISIPKRGSPVQLVVDFAQQKGDHKLTIEQFNARYVAPAVAAIAARIEDQFLNHYRFAQLPLPQGIFHAQNRIHLEGLKNVRHLIAWDMRSDQPIHRFDVYLEPSGIAA